VGEKCDFFKVSGVRYCCWKVNAPVTTLHCLERLNMTSYPLSNVLLPAVFISSAVFSTLTLPFALIKSEPVGVEIPPFFSGEIQPIFNGEHKEVAIPYIGFAIVVSVGAGIASVEVTRRWQAYRESAKAEESLQNIPQNSFEKEAHQEALKRPEYRPEFSEIDFFPKDDVFSNQSLIAPNATTEEPSLTVEDQEHFFDSIQLGLPQSIIPETTSDLPVVSEEINFSQLPQEENSIASESDQVVSQSVGQDLDSALTKIIESRKQYQICRIKVPHLEQRLFSILVNGEYYSFLRAERTIDKVREVMEKVGYRIEKTVITKTEKGYVIWRWEPEAYLEIK
jgi:hypothetical protein